MNRLMEIQTRPVEKYYLPEKTIRSTPMPVDEQFRQLLRQKIMLAMSLNEQMNNVMPSPFYESYLPSFHQVSASFTSPSYQQSIAAYEKAQNRTSVTPGATSYDSIIRQASEKYQVDEKLIHAIIKIESNYNPQVTSHAGAAGLMQLMPATAREVGVTDRYDIVQNIFGGTHYFSKMLRRHHGDIKLALAAYNAGPGNVKKYGGIPPFKETQNYVQKVMNYYES